MSKKKYIILIVWIICNLFILRSSILNFYSETNPNTKGEIVLFHLLIILILTFPSGLIATLIFSIVFEYIYFLNFLNKNQVYNMIIVSIICTIFGYFQWFILIPKIWEKFKKIYYQRNIKIDN
jgi:hypothetical protein